MRTIGTALLSLLLQPFASSFVTALTLRHGENSLFSRHVRRQRLVLSSLPSSQFRDDDSPERTLEQLSQTGARKIAALSLPERTKRALLAEAIEDDMFHTTETLEELVQPDGTVSEENQPSVLELTERVKSLRIKYKELVSGDSSSVLNSLESVLGGD